MREIHSGMKASRNTERVFRQTAIDPALFSFVWNKNISTEMETRRLFRARSLGMNTRAILELHLQHVYRVRNSIIIAKE